MSSLLQGYVTGRCFNQTTVKIFILVCNPWGHRLRPEFLSCTTCDICPRILYSGCPLGRLERSGQAELCVWSMWGRMSFPEFASSHTVLDRKEHVLWLQWDYSLSMAGSNCCFEIIFPVLDMQCPGRKKWPMWVLRSSSKIQEWHQFWLLLFSPFLQCLMTFGLITRIKFKNSGEGHRVHSQSLQWQSLRQI